MIYFVLFVIAAYLVAVIYMTCKELKDMDKREAERDYNAEIEQAADRIIAILDDVPNTTVHWHEEY